MELLTGRSETGQLFANPDGTWTSEEYAVPIRVRRGTDWVPVDTTLRQTADGTITPVAVPVDLRLSNGGTAPMVSLGRADRSITMTWPDQLPQPRLRDNMATYPEVLPGVDLTITAEPTGFRQLLVVKTRAAAANPALREITFGTRTTGLTLGRNNDGSMVARDSSGTPMFGSPTAVMWDSVPAPTSVAAADRAVDRPELTPRQKTMRTELGADRLTVRPDPAMLTDPATTFPLYIDPSWDNYKSAWLHINTQSDNQLAWGWDQGSGAKVGKAYNDPCCVYRSIFRIPMNAASHSADVTDAKFYIDLDHSPNCTKTNVQLWETGGINTSTTWGNTGSGHWKKLLDTRAGAAYSGCTDPYAMEFGGTALTDLLQRAANGQWSEVNLGLKAPDETNQAYWKKFTPSTAHVSVTYNTKPNTPTSFSTVPPKPCGTATAPTPMNTTTPSFSARLGDPNLDNVTGTLELLDGGTVIQSLTSGLVTTNSMVAWPPVPAGVLPEDQPTKVFGYRAQTTDSGGMVSTDTATCYFTVDREIPGSPIVESTDFPFGEPVLDVGQVGTLALSPGYGPTGPNTDIEGYRYGFQQDKLTGWAKADTDGRATIPMVLWSTSRTLYVQAIDWAGNPSLEDSPCLCTAHSLAANPSGATPARKQADVNGDGFADVSAVFELPYGRSAAWTFINNQAGGSYQPYLGWDTGVNGGFPGYRRTEVNGDFTADGLADIAIFREDPDRKLRLYLAQSDSHRYDVIGDPKWTSPVGWKLSNLHTFTGDFDGDGRDDIGAALSTGTTTWTAYVWTGASGLSTATTWYSATSAKPWSQVKVYGGDFNGDGRDDIAALNDMGNNELRFYTYASGGSGFAHPVQRYTSGTGAFTFAQAKWVVGNFDGDTGGPAGQGRDDLVAIYDYGSARTKLITYKFGDTGVTWQYWWDSGVGGYDSSKTQPTVGDFNRDGRPDIAALYDVTGGTAKLHTFLSGSAAFTVDLAAPLWSGYIGAVPENVAPEPGRKYRLVAWHSGKCVDVTGSSTSNGALIQQWSCNTTPNNNQVVTLEPVGSGPYYALRFAHSGKCLDVSGGSFTNGAAAQQWSCSENGNQQWQLEYLTGVGQDAQVWVRVAHSNQCLVVNNASVDNGAKTVQWPCANGAGHLYHLRLEP